MNRGGSVGTVNPASPNGDEHLQVLRQIKEEISKLSTKYSSFETKLDEVIASQKFISDRYDEMNAKIKSQDAEIKSYVKIVHNLEATVRDLEQRSRNINIEVNGLPETQNENSVAAAEKISEVLGVKGSTCISVAHRVPSKRSPKPLIIALATRGQRDLWLNAAKNRSKDRDEHMLANELSTKFPATKIFINEHLTPEKKRLLMKTKSSAKEAGYQYVWTVDGKILVRKEPKAKVHRVENEDDIAKLFNSLPPLN